MSDPVGPLTPSRQFLGFLGITAVEFVYAQGLAMGDDHRAAALADAERGVERLLAAAA
ncbi:MAG: hypothetical protein U5K43_12265 [Halofilum sp. (in: g-proteobacteria)]|nr:hypothetical protein [Halofilum sp. (in: g-proteobacteria)]